MVLKVVPVREFTRSQQLYLSLCAVFVASLILGDLIGGKAFVIELKVLGDQPVSVGLFAFPVTFLLTDVVNEFYGRRGARFMTMLGLFVSIYSFAILNIAQVPVADSTSFYKNAEFDKVFGIGGRLFIASMIAYLFGQYLDIYVFAFWKGFTQSKHLWLRATGSTLASQIVDTVVINFLFWNIIPNLTNSPSQSLTWVTKKAFAEYVIKLVIAIGLTPAVYALHGLVTRWFGIEPEPLAVRVAEAEEEAAARKAGA